VRHIITYGEAIGQILGETPKHSAESAT